MMRYNFIRRAAAGVAALMVGLLCGCENETGADARIGITSEPSGAEVFLNGSLQGVTPQKISGLPPGEYVVELRKSGYARNYETLVLLEGREVTLRKPLEPLCGLLLVESEPAGSEVSIAGAIKGRTPVLVSDLPLGEYTVEFNAPGLPPRTKMVALESRVPVKLKLRHAPRVAVNSSPPGAEIFVDGELVGTAPLVLSDLGEGEHRVEARMNLFDSQLQPVMLFPGLNDPIEFNLDKNSGALLIDTEPAMVQVFVDGELYGITQPKEGADSISTPLKVPLKAGVEHRIQLIREGYSSSSLTLTTAVDEIVTRHEVLKRIFVFDTRITTQKEIIDCRLEYKLPNGNIYYERAPGIYNTAKAADIISVEPITFDDPSNRKARALMEQNRLNAPEL